MGLQGMLPSSVTVAHTFSYIKGDGKKIKTQLHDCGITYHPEAPYILCIMTQGKDQKIQLKVMQEISQAMYAEVDAKAKEHQ